MEDLTSKGRHELNLASRKAEEPAWRRFQATRWLDGLVGSLGMSTQPTEREFISCLRNGLVLCNVINKIKPGSVPKVVEIHSASQVPTWDSQPLPAYQYFENIRNFLVAVEELKLPAFEASDLERDNLEVGSSAKVVDCILALKAYHECKQTSGGHGFLTSPRSPMVMHSASRIHSRASGAISSDPCRKLDMSTACNSLPPPESGTQNLEGNIQVYCRIRPAFSAEARSVVDVIGEDGSLVVLDPSKPQKDGRKIFQFNRVFGPTATQDEIFKDTQPLIRSVMDGYNVCIFAYGQTGSGKTHTMCGPSGGLTKDRGIHYRALTDLLQLSNKRTDTVKYDIHVQMVEIYNEQVRDLLAEDSTTTKLEIQSCDSENGPSVPDATMHSVKSTSDILSLMKLGEVNRVVSSTAINNQSSRSHSILTVLVHGKDVSGSILCSCLYLVDLAGSDAKSEVTRDGLKEAQYINKSLSCLGDVIAALAQKSSHIPYRDSKLTLLLQNSLGGHAKTLMFAHVSPEADSFGETISTLKFAQRASTVELGAAHMNKESTEVKALNEQSLKKANKEAQNVHPNVPNSPLGKQAVNEQTPPRSRRLSIENCRTMEKEKPHSKPERTPPRPRRLSTENCNTMKKLKLTMNNEEIPETGSKPGEQRAPRSPTSAVYSSQVLKTDGREKIPALELPKTPEPQPTLARNEVQIMTSSTNGKGSQIRIPVRTIGKLIIGSDKRLRTPMFHDPQLGHLPPELLIPIVAELPPKDRLEVLVSSKEVFDLLIDRRELWASTKPLGTAKDEESFRLNLLPVLRSLNKINDGNFDFLEFPRGTTFFDFSQAMMLLSRVTLKGRRVTLKGLGLPEWPNYTWTTVSVCFDYVRGISLLKVPGAILQRDQFVKAITVHNNGIKTLIVYRCIIDIKVAEYISKYFKELEELRVSKYCILTGNGILHVLKNIRTLKRFDMSGCGCHGLTDTILKEGERLDVFSHDSVDNACGACQQDLASEWFLAWCTHKAASPEQVFPLDRLPTRAYSD